MLKLIKKKKKKSIKEVELSILLTDGWICPAADPGSQKALDEVMCFTDTCKEQAGGRIKPRCCLNTQDTGVQHIK